MSNELAEVRAIICQVGQLPAIDADADLYHSGFASVKALELLVELESACGVRIPDERFIQARTPRALQSLISCLKGE